MFRPVSNLDVLAESTPLGREQLPPCYTSMIPEYNVKNNEPEDNSDNDFVRELQLVEKQKSISFKLPHH